MTIFLGIRQIAANAQSPVHEMGWAMQGGYASGAAISVDQWACMGEKSCMMFIGGQLAQ